LKDKKDRILEIKSEIDMLENKVAKFKSRTPFAVFFGVLFSLVSPYLPRRYGRKPLIEDWGYLNVLLFTAILYFVIYIVSYYYVVDKSKKAIEALYRRKFSLENNDKPYSWSKKNNRG